MWVWLLAKIGPLTKIIGSVELRPRIHKGLAERGRGTQSSKGQWEQRLAEPGCLQRSVEPGCWLCEEEGLQRHRPRPGTGQGQRTRRLLGGGGMPGQHAHSRGGGQGAGPALLGHLVSSPDCHVLTCMKNSLVTMVKLLGS